MPPSSAFPPNSARGDGPAPNPTVTTGPVAVGRHRRRSRKCPMSWAEIRMSMKAPKAGPDTEPSVAALRAEILEKVADLRPPTVDAAHLRAREDAGALCRAGLRRGGSRLPRRLPAWTSGSPVVGSAGSWRRVSPNSWGVTECRLVNSGSSANLLAFSTLTSPRWVTAGSAPGTRSSPWPPAFRPPWLPPSSTGSSRSSSMSTR